jgi:hypothetical protein
MSKKLSFDFEEEFIYTFVGIASTLKDYRLVFYLNKIFYFQLKRGDSFEFMLKNQLFSFSFYYYVDQQNMLNYYLLSNKDQSVKLLKDLKHFDYILVIEGEMEDEALNNFAKQFKSINGVLHASVLDNKLLNKVDNLSEAFEIHVDKTLKTP